MSGLCVLCPEGKQHPVTGTFGCDRCVDRLVRLVSEIPEFVAALSVMPGGGTPGRRAPGFGSRSPARDDVIAVLDYRTNPDRSVIVVGGVEKPDGEMNNNLRSVLGTLHGIAKEWREERRITVPKEPPTIKGEALFLATWMVEIARHEWIEELAEDIRELHGLVRGLAGGKPKAVAACECGGGLYPDEEWTAVKCSACGRRWERREWLRMGLLGGRTA